MSGIQRAMNFMKPKHSSSSIVRSIHIRYTELQREFYQCYRTSRQKENLSYLVAKTCLQNLPTHRRRSRSSQNRLFEPRCSASTSSFQRRRSHPIRRHRPSRRWPWLVVERRMVSTRPKLSTAQPMRKDWNWRYAQPTRSQWAEMAFKGSKCSH